MSVDAAVRLTPPPPLPVRSSDWVRKVKDRRSVNDRVEELHLELVADEDYLRFLLAVDDEQSVEGKVEADRTMAAQKIRALAEKKKSPVANEKLVTIRRCIGVVMARYGESLSEREARNGEAHQIATQGSAG